LGKHPEYIPLVKELKRKKCRSSLIPKLVQEDSVVREEYRALEVMTVREERRNFKIVMKRRKMGMKTRMRSSTTMRTMMMIFYRNSVPVN